SLCRFPGLFFKSQNGFVRDAPSRFAVQGKAGSQKLALSRSRHAALLLVHAEFELRGDERGSKYLLSPVLPFVGYECKCYCHPNSEPIEDCVAPTLGPTRQARCSITTGIPGRVG